MPPRYQAAAHRFLARITPSAVNGAGPARDRGHRLLEAGPLPGLPLYEGLIGDGIAAYTRAGPVDHVTSRRLMTWLDARPQSRDLAAVRDQIDRADATLYGLRQHGRVGRAHPRQVRPDIDGPRITVLARQEHETQTVTLVVLEATTASIAIATRADEREARIRKIEQISRSLPEGSYGRRNLER
jgi:hypothetical protein